MGPLGNIRFKSRELMYIVYGFLIAFIIGLIGMILSFVPVLGFVAAVIVATVILSRLSVILPAIAIDNDMGVARAWNLTDGYTLTCFGSLVALPVILAFPLYFQDDTLYSSVVAVVYGSIVMIVSVTLLSNTYKNLINIGGPRDEEEFIQ